VDKRAALDIVVRLRQGIEARGIRLQKVILHGSYAAGTHTAGSDIDVVLISDDFKGMGYWERVALLTDVIYDLFVPVEAVALTPEEWEHGDSFVVDYARNGEVLYAA
jgi:uncharacterized protein